MVAALGALAVVPSAAQASACPGEPPLSQVFSEFGDFDNYFLAPGGDFAGPATDWSLEGDSYVSGDTLYLGQSDTVVSPPICVAPGYPHGRMYGAVGRRGSDISKVRVSVIYDGEHADESTKLRLDSSTLEPTDRFPLDESAFGLDPVTGTATVRLVFEAKNAPAIVDDVYIDPRARN